MANASPPKFTLYVETGVGSPTEKAFVSGTEVAPFSVGTAGMWRVSGQGIADVHGFLYFDGETVFVQSAGTRFIVTANGNPVGTDWSPIRPPCRIQMGGVVLHLDEALDDEGQTVAMDQPPQRVVPSTPVAAPSARPFKPGEFVAPSDDGATRVQDISTGSRNLHPSVPLRAAPPISGSPPGPRPPAAFPQHPSSAEQTSQTQTAAGKNPLADAFTRARASFNAMPPIIKLAAGGIPILLMALVTMQDAPPPPRPKRLDGGVARDGAAAQKDAAPAASNQIAAPIPPSTPDDDPEAGVVEITDPDSGVITRMPRGKKTEERKAIDAAFTGKYAEAAELYDQLARENPSKPAYAEAAKIMRAKAAHK